MSRFRTGIDGSSSSQFGVWRVFAGREVPLWAFRVMSRSSSSRSDEYSVSSQATSSGEKCQRGGFGEKVVEILPSSSLSEAL